MKVNFRQGIVSHQIGGFLQITGTTVALNADNRPVTITIGHRDTNYTHAEDNSIAVAWSLTPTTPNEYLYWDFDQLTFARTFGSTTLEPVAQSVPPGLGNAPIIAVVPGVASPISNGSFTVDGHYVLAIGRPFKVENSTVNNGDYTVQSTSYDVIFGTTTIVVNEAVVGAGSPIDGDLSLDVDSNNIALKTPGRHWYDTTNNIHYELVSSTWTEVLRVFAAWVVNGSTLISLGQNATTPNDFTGTQVGDNTFSASGKVLFGEQAGDPIRRDDNTFFTTEDQFFTNQSRVDALRLESNVSRAQSEAGGGLAAYAIVAWTGDGKINSATYDDVGSTVVGVLTEPLSTNQVGAVIVQGTVTNSAWNWTTGIDAVPVGSELWVNTGELVTADPNITTPLLHPEPRVPVARVLSVDTVIFEQGLGGIGPQGPVNSLTTLPPATASDLGAVTLVTPSSDAARAFVISDTDSRLTDARQPLAHIHQAIDILFTPGGGILSNDLQNGLVEVGLTKLSLTGGSMSGALSLSGGPTADLHATTKAYVDSVAAGLDTKESVLIATVADILGVYNPNTGTGGSGSFIGADVTKLDGVIPTDFGLVIGSRILVKDQTDAKQNGIYVVTSLTGSPATIMDIERAPDQDGNPPEEVSAGNYTFIQRGAVHAGQGWILTDIHPGDDIVLNVHDITWSQVSTATAYVGSATIDINGSNIISVNPLTVDALQWNSNTLSLTTPVAGQPLIFDGTSSWNNAAFSLPSSYGTASYVLTSDGSGGTSWAATAPGGIQNPLTEDINTNSYGLFTIAAGSPVVDAPGFTITTGFQYNSTLQTVPPTNNVHIKAGDSYGDVIGWPGDPATLPYGKGGNIILEPGFNQVIGSEGQSFPNSHGMVEIRGVDNYPAQSPGIIGTVDSFTSADATNLLIRSGSYLGGAGSTFAGDVNIEGGSNSGTSYAGSFNFYAGSSTYGRGGNVKLYAGNSNVEPAASVTNHGGYLYLKGGYTNKGYGGDIRLYGGDSGGATSLSRGGHIKIKAGSSLSGTYNGGSYGASSVYITAGNNEGVGGTGGHIKLIAGVGNGGGDGVIQVRGSNFSGTATMHLFDEDSAGNPKVVFKAPTLAADTLFELPNNNGNAGDALLTNSSGNTYWGGVVTNPMTADLDTNGWSLITSAVVEGTANDITLASGDSYGGYSGAINLTAGTNGGATGYGGDVSIVAGSNTFAGGGYAGSVTITAGNTAYTGFSEPGEVTITAGDTAGPFAGSVVMYGGNSTSYSGTNGYVVLIGKDSINGYGGAILITAGNTGYPTGKGGNVRIEAGNGYYGGNFIVQPGSGSGGAYSSYQGALVVNGPNGSGSGLLRIMESSGYYVELTATSLPNNTTFSFPPSNGNSGEVLTAQGSGVTAWQAPAAVIPNTKPTYEKITISGSPVSDVLNTTVSTVGLAGSPSLIASLQVFRNGMLQNEDTISGSPVIGDFAVTGANQLTFATGLLKANDTIIIYVFN